MASNGPRPGGPKPDPRLLTGPKPLDAWISEDSRDIYNPNLSASADRDESKITNSKNDSVDLMNLEFHISRANQRIYGGNHMMLDSLIPTISLRIQSNPNDKKALFVRASTYLKKGQYYDALEDCNKLIDLDPEYIGAYFTRGCIYEKLNEFEKALADYSRVLALDPLHVNTVFARGACLIKMGEFQKALEDYREALKKDEERTKLTLKKMLERKNLAHLFNGRASSIFLTKDMLEEIGIEAEQDDVVAHPDNMIDFIRYEEGEFKWGVGSDLNNPAASKQTSDLAQNTSDMTNPHSTIFMRRFKKTTITPKMEEIQEVDVGKLADEYHEKGYAERLAGDFKKAIGYYTKALEYLPEHHNVGILIITQCLFNRGFAYDKLGMHEEAIDDYSAALQYNPKNCFAYYNR